MASVIAVIHYDSEQKLFYASVPAIPCAHTQATTWEEILDNIKEVIDLCIEDDPAIVEGLPTLVALYHFYDIEARK